MHITQLAFNDYVYHIFQWQIDKYLGNNLRFWLKLTDYDYIIIIIIIIIIIMSGFKWEWDME